MNTFDDELVMRAEGTVAAENPRALPKPPVTPDRSEQLRKNARAVAFQCPAGDRGMDEIEGKVAVVLKRFQPAPDDPAYLELKQFVSYVCGAHGKNPAFHFFAVMDDEIRKIHGSGGTAYPWFLFGKQAVVEDPVSGSNLPSKVFPKSFSVTPGKDKAFKSLPLCMAKLRLLNSLGYDIYGYPNPMMYGRRTHLTVPCVHFLLAEGDGDLEPQLRACQELKDDIGVAVFSGGRSVYMLFRLPSPVWNRSYLPSRELLDMARNPKRLEKKRSVQDTLTELLDKGFHKRDGEDGDFRRAAGRLLAHIRDATGLCLDTPVTDNIASLTRIPGFEYGRTGRLSKIVHFNPAAEWNPWAAGNDKGVEPKDGHGGGGGRGAVIPDPSPTTAATAEAKKDPRESAQAGTTPLAGKDTTRAYPSLILTIDVNEAPAGCGKYLDDLDEYEELVQFGVPCTGQRRALHRRLLNVARILGWGKVEADGFFAVDEQRTALEWERILLVDGDNISVPVQQDIEEMRVLAREENGKRRPLLFAVPDCTRLPDLDDDRLRTLRRRLEWLVADDAGGGLVPASEASTVVAGACNIVSAVLWDRIRRFPAQCRAGKVNIMAKEMQAECPYRRWRPVRDWMFARNIISRKDGEYVPRRKTYAYWVNIPLTLWLLGFGTKELVWRYDTPAVTGQVRSAGHNP